MKNKIFSLIIVFALIISFTSGNSLNIFNPSIVKAEEESTLDRSIFLSKEELNEFKFRKEFGLDANLSTIQSAKKNYEIGQYGVHLSPEEEETLSKRITFQEKINPVLTQILNDEFNGEFSLYIDQSNNGTYHIGVKREVYNQQTIDKMIDSLFTDEYKYEFKFISYSEGDLDNLVNDIIKNQSYLEKQDIIINQVYTDVINQKVNIGILNASDDKKSYFNTYLEI